jgi:hypothetical protein
VSVPASSSEMPLSAMVSSVSSAPPCKKIINVFFFG